MSVKLKTFEDIWKTNIQEKSRKYDDGQSTSSSNQTNNDRNNKKQIKQQIDQNDVKLNQYKSNDSQASKQSQGGKQSGLLNEKDWEYLDKLGEKFRILEEKSSNYQKNFQNSMNQMKKRGDDDENESQEMDFENQKSSMNRKSPIKQEANKCNNKKYNQTPDQVKYQQKNGIPNQNKALYEQTIPKQEQFSKTNKEKQSQSTQRITQQAQQCYVRNNFMQNENDVDGDGEEYDENTLSMRMQDKSDYECTFQPNHLKKSPISQSQKGMFQQKQRDLTPNHLYDDAIMRKQKQEVIEKLVIKETKKQTNQSKIGVNSQKIILKKIEEFLQALIVSIETDEDGNHSENEANGYMTKKEGEESKKVLKFEGVGFFFQQLGIFRSVKFEENENGDISISQLREMNNVEIDRMKQEMTFHEELWKIMSIDQLQYKEPDEIENVSSKLLFDITMVLLELKLTLAQSDLLLNEIILSNLFEDDLNRGQEVIDIYFSVSHNWTLETLVKQFRQIFDDKTALMDFYANWNKRLNLQQGSQYENSEMSFHPQINQRSRIMDSMIQQTKSSNNQKRHDILFEQHKLKQERQQQQKVEKLQKEVEKCTFKPQTNAQKNNKDQRMKESKSSFQDIYDQNDEQQLDEQKRYEQLFKIHNRKQNQIKEIKEYVEFYRQEQELEQCTFKPQTNEVNREMLNEGQLQNVKGLNQQLQRMYKARKDKLEKEMFFEKQRYILSQQNSKPGQKKVVPFSFEERQKQKKGESQEQRKLIGHVDVNITKTKKGRVTLHEGDNALELANNFSKIYNISSEMTETLADMLQQYLDKYNASQNQE